jgi:ribosome biogenesis protein Nip4
MDETIAAIKINQEDFEKLYDLCLKQEWLTGKWDALFALWNLCDLKAQQDLICMLLDNYTFISSKALEVIGQRVAEHIEEVWRLSPDKTKIVAFSNDKTADGSQMFLQSIKNKFESAGWTEGNFINSLPVAMHNAVDGDNLVLVDDFVGTGLTAERKIKWLLTKLGERRIHNVKVYLVSAAGMEFARSKIDNLGIEYYTALSLKKGISDRLDGQLRTDAIHWMKNLESKLANCEKFSLGFMASESLFAFEAFNVPNNVFPIFWWPALSNGQRRRTLFKRL